MAEREQRRKLVVRYSSRSPGNVDVQHPSTLSSFSYTSDVCTKRTNTRISHSDFYITSRPSSPHDTTYPSQNATRRFRRPRRVGLPFHSFRIYRTFRVHRKKNIRRRWLRYTHGLRPRCRDGHPVRTSALLPVCVRASLDMMDRT